MHRSEDFLRTIRGGSRAGRTTVVVHCRVTSGATRRVGFVVAKIVGGAVVRNKVRRRLRGMVLEHGEALPEGTDVVVRALGPAASATYPALAADYRSALAAALRRQRGTLS